MTQHAKGGVTIQEAMLAGVRVTFWCWLIATLVLGGGLSIYAIVSQALKS